MHEAATARWAEWDESPLATTVDAAAALMPFLTVRRGEPDAAEQDWLALEALTDVTVADAQMRRLRDHSYQGVQTVAGNMLFRQALVGPLRLLGYAFAAERRVLSLQRNIYLGGREHLDALCLVAPRATVLATDPMADLPGVRVVPDQAALTDALFAELEATVAPLIEALARLRLVSPVNGWAGALDFLAYGFQMAGRGPLTPDAAWADWERAVAGRDFPTRRRPRRFTYTVDGAGDELLVRSGCCLYYMLPGDRANGLRLCTSCYIRPDDQRLAILIDYKRRLAREAAGGTS